MRDFSSLLAPSTMAVLDTAWIYQAYRISQRPLALYCKIKLSQFSLFPSLFYFKSDQIYKLWQTSKQVFWIYSWLGPDICLVLFGPSQSPNQQNMNLASCLKFSFTPRVGHTDIMSPLHNTGLFCQYPLLRAPQEIVLLSLGKEVAWRRPLAHRIDGCSSK